MATSAPVPDLSGGNGLAGDAPPQVTPDQQQQAAAPAQPDPATAQAQPMQGGDPSAPGSILATPTQPSVSAAPPPARHSLMRNILIGALAGLSADKGTDPSDTGGFGGLANAGGGFLAGRAAIQQDQGAPAAAARQQAVQKQQDDKAQADIDNTKARTAATVQTSIVQGAKASVDARDADVKYSDHMTGMAKNISDLLQSGSGATVVTGSDGKPVDNIADAFKYAGGAGEAAKQIAAGTLVAVPTGPGKFEFYHVSPDWQHSKTTAPSTITVTSGYDPKSGKPITQTQTIPAGAVSNGTALSMQATALTSTTKALTASTQAAKAKKDAAAGDGGMGGMGGGAGLNPAEYQSIVKGIASGDIDAGSLLRYGKPAQMKMFADARLINPNLSNVDYQAKLSNAKAFSSGKPAEQIQSFNAMIGHLDEAQQAIGALRNTSSPLMNTPFNKLSEASGNPQVEAVRVPLVAARTEFQNFLNNNHALSVEDVAEGKQLMSDNMSPAQFETGAKQMMATAAQRLDALNQRYSNTAGKNYPGIMSQQTQGILAKNGYGAQVQHMTGQAPPSPPPAGASAVVKNAQGQPIGHVVNNKFVANGAQ